MTLTQVNREGVVRAPFRAWLGRFEDRPIADHDNGAARAALILDDRDDETLRRVFSNAVAVLGDAWNIRWLARRDGNDLLASHAFWEAIPEEHVLIFQRDTVLLTPVPEAAFGWDMIGAPCPWRRQPWWTMNGGFSLRRSCAMLGALDAEACPTDEPEDVYFTRVLRQWGGCLPDGITAAAFAAESDELCISPALALPVGIHGTDKDYMDDEIAWRFVDLASRRYAGRWH